MVYKQSRRPASRPRDRPSPTTSGPSRETRTATYAEGEVIEVAAGAEDLHAHLSTYPAAFDTLGAKELCPGSGMLEKINASTDESAVKRHAEYEEAKTGEVPAAKRLAAQLAGLQTLNAIRQLVGDRKVALVPVHALENQGYNRIPAAFAELLAEKLGLEVEIGIIQANVVNHTGASGWERMVRPPLFDGAVIPDRDYLMVDDFVGQGSTLANLRGYLIGGGGRVLGRRH